MTRSSVKGRMPRVLGSAALALALEPGIQPAYFPGGHGGFASHLDMFAARLHHVLSHA